MWSPTRSPTGWVIKKKPCLPIKKWRRRPRQKAPPNLGRWKKIWSFLAQILKLSFWNTKNKALTESMATWFSYKASNAIWHLRWCIVEQLKDFQYYQESQEPYLTWKLRSIIHPSDHYIYPTTCKITAYQIIRGVSASSAILPDLIKRRTKISSTFSRDPRIANPNTSASKSSD